MIKILAGAVMALVLLGGGVLVGKSLHKSQPATVSNAQILKTLASAQQRSQQSNTELLGYLKSLNQSIQSLNSDLRALTNNIQIQIQGLSYAAQTPTLEPGSLEGQDEALSEPSAVQPSEVEPQPTGPFSFLPPDERQFQEYLLTLPPDEQARQSHERWLNKNRAELERAMQEMDALDPYGQPSDG